MDQVQSLPRDYPDAFGLRAPLKLSMTIKEPLFPNHGDFTNSSRTNDPWASSQQNEPSSTPGDLVSLAWLQKGDIIQIAPLDGEEDHQNCFENSTASLASSKSDDFLSTRQSTNIDEPLDFSPFSLRPPAQSELHTATSTSAVGIQRPASADTEHYSSPCISDPSHLVNTHQLNFNGQGLAKPNYSYTHLIFMAIESTPQKCMTVNQIYNWCETNFPFYKHAGAGWKNSLRHNLSINKSFKRLPRDSRPGDCVIVQCRRLSFFCPKINELEESEDDEGPGRGAFWTVEPRERPTLMDAIKRNPWNFANMAALVSGQSDQNANLNIFGLRRFGLTQSAPGQVLRAAGMGSNDLLDANSESISNTIQLPSGGVRLVPTTDGRFVATRDVRVQHLDIETPSSEGDINGTPTPGSFVLPDSRYWLSPESNTDAGAGVEVEWSAEDEEKYAQTLQLLLESSDCGSQSTNAMTCNDRSDSSKLPGHEGLFLADEMKLCTKQRRKSRLQPTRIVEDIYPYTFALMGKCNECKENAAAGCESCLAKRRRFLSNSSLNDRAFVDVANSLDSDQECGPAGGPTVRKSNLSHVPDTAVENKPQDSSNACEASEEVADEVYVTPAPYIDHEYSHCHAQLRRPEEIRLVNTFNELYCAEALKRLSKGRSLSKRQSESKLRSRLLLTPYDESDAEYDDAADRAFTLEDRATYSEDDSDISEDLEELSRSDEISEVSGHQKRRRALRGSFRTLGPHLVDNTLRIRDSSRRRSSNHSSRARGRRKFGFMCHPGSSTVSVTRRSKRVIRAPKRPYDDFEDPFAIEGEELNGFVTRTAEKIDDIYAAGVHSEPLVQSHPSIQSNSDALNHEEPLIRNSRGRRGRKRGRRRGRRSNSFYAIKSNESENPNFTPDPTESTTDEDEELNYLRLARQRQQMENSMEQNDLSSTASSGSPNSRASFSDRNKCASYKTYSASSPVEANNTRATSLGLGAVWGQSRWAMVQKFSAQSWPSCTQTDSDQDDLREESASVVEANGEDLEECDVEEMQPMEPKTGERTTVEAAQLLLGISQMQSFRRQSGYVSLDSSGASTSLTIDAPESAKNAESDSPEVLPMTPTVSSTDRQDSSTVQCSSPSHD